jgi:hypothetical protein
MVCTSYQQSAITHGYVDSVTDVRSTFMDMCTNGTGAQCRRYFIVLSLNGYATHAYLMIMKNVVLCVWTTSHIMGNSGNVSQGCCGGGAPYCGPRGVRFN